MTNFKKAWPFIPLPAPTVYIYKTIQLYPVVDSSTWPFPIRKMNMPMFVDAMIWLHNNKIETMGPYDYTQVNTQNVILKFTSEEDVLAFTLIFGDLLE